MTKKNKNPLNTRNTPNRKPGLSDFFLSRNFACLAGNLIREVA